MSPADVIATEEFINHAVTKTELKTLEWVLLMLSKHNVKIVEAQIKQYMKELENE